MDGGGGVGGVPTPDDDDDDDSTSRVVCSADVVGSSSPPNPVRILAVSSTSGEVTTASAMRWSAPMSTCSAPAC
eukprot:30799-Pelagococcus_subviridis.AAC.3